MAIKRTTAEINALTAVDFQQLFQNVIESWPEAAAQIVSERPFVDLADLLRRFDVYLDTIDDDIKRRILCLHPDLAGRLLDEKRLTAESANEQASAGLDQLTAQQKSILINANVKYTKKFGFPFVICVRENNKIERILEGFDSRENNDQSIELNVGIGEVKKICAIRIKDIVED